MERHKRLIAAYQGDRRALAYARTDLDVLKEHHRFLLDEDEVDGAGWEMRMVKAYHDQLFKEYCLADLSRIEEPNAPIGLRWRTESEVVNGRGQFSCGSLACQEQRDLRSWELPFGYSESGVKKVALVKLRLCRTCSTKLPSSKQNRPKLTDELFP